MPDLRSKMIRLAASMPKGSTERRALLKVLAAIRVRFSRPSRGGDGSKTVYADVPGEETDKDARKVGIHQEGRGAVTWLVQAEIRHKLRYSTTPIAEGLSLDMAKRAAARWLQKTPFP